jgi:hypothetical protein
MGRKRIAWKAGDNFLVPLEDGTFGQGQVLGYELHALDSAVCAFSSRRFETSPDSLVPITEPNLIAVLFVTRDLLDRGYWKILSNGPIVVQGQRFLDLEGLRRKGFVGAKCYGSRIVADFLSAYHRLLPWNAYFDPNYLDELLVSPDRKPADVLLK